MFKKGDCVRHKSGGSEMVAAEDEVAGQNLLCTWREGGQQKKDEFDPAFLVACDRGYLGGEYPSGPKR
jgi:uncharacterized protein YodC (DUF2158 family)